MRTLSLILALLAASPAHALSCAWGATDVFPETGATDVPTNLVLRVGYLSASPDDQPLRLVSDAGDEVAGTWGRVSEGEQGASVWAFSPAAPLAANTTYHLVDAEAEAELDTSFTYATFQTGAGPDLDAPDAPVVTGVRRDTGRGYWGSWHHHQIEVASDPEPRFFEIDVSDDPEFSTFRTVQAGGFVAEGGGVEVVIGSGVCGGDLELDRRDRFVRVRAIDLAGNRSADDTDGRARGCAAVGGGALGWLAAGLALLSARRRTVRVQNRES